MGIDSAESFHSVVYLEKSFSIIDKDSLNLT